MLSLVMPIYVPPGGEDVAHRCLDSIEKNTNGVCRFESMVFILQSDVQYERLEDRIQAFGQHPRWRHFVEVYNQPLGFTKAFNRGLQMTTGDVVQLNSDTVVPPNWLDTLVADQDLTGGVMCCDDNHLRIGPGIHKDRAWGACFYLPQAVIDKAGLWDEKLNYRYSDQDYWIRCRQAGFDVSVTGNVRLHHENSFSVRHQAKDPQVARQIRRERREMRRRHGAKMFTEWVEKQSEGR